MINDFFIKLNKVLSSPIKGSNMLRRRLFPLGIKPKDPEAFRIGSWNYGKAKRTHIQNIFPGIDEISIKLHKAYKRDLYTSVDIQEIVAICAIARFVDAKSILEIGTFEGNTTLNLALNTSEETIITTVDLPKNWSGKYELSVPLLYNNVNDQNNIGIQFKTFKEFHNKIKQIYGDSAQLDYSKMRVPFDMIFIDGCHHYNYVKRDTENAIEFIRESGVIIWHDYGMIEDISKVIDNTFRDLQVKVIRGTRLAVSIINK